MATNEESALAGSAGLVTGGASGIGSAIVQRLCRAGARVLVVDTGVDAAEDVAAVVSASGGDAVAHRCDIRAVEEITAACQTCVARWGRLDFVVANAGVGDSAPIREGDPERWRQVVETNALGTMHTARAALEVMGPAGSGDIVIVSSLSGRTTYAGEAAYIGSKWATVGFGHALRLEAQGLGIRVTLVEPGLVDTPLSRANAYAAPLFEKITPLTPDDVADTVAFALTRPRHVLVREIAFQPIGQELP